MPIPVRRPSPPRRRTPARATRPPPLRALGPLLQPDRAALDRAGPAELLAPALRPRAHAAEPFAVLNHLDGERVADGSPERQVRIRVDPEAVVRDVGAEDARQ